jgi:hypothetical protein
MTSIAVGRLVLQCLDRHVIDIECLTSDCMHITISATYQIMKYDNCKTQCFWIFSLWCTESFWREIDITILLPLIKINSDSCSVSLSHTDTTTTMSKRGFLYQNIKFDNFKIKTQCWMFSSTCPLGQIKEIILRIMVFVT